MKNGKNTDLNQNIEFGGPLKKPEKGQEKIYPLQQLSFNNKIKYRISSVKPPPSFKPPPPL